MTESQTRSLIERYFSAFNAADYDAMLACLSEGVAHDVNGAREIGKEKFRWHLGTRSGHFSEKGFDVAIMVGEGGGRAAAEFTLRGSYGSTKEGLPPASGQNYSIIAGMFFDIDDGLISRVTAYHDAEALRAQLATN